jgi:hypothetical protein
MSRSKRCRKWKPDHVLPGERRLEHQADGGALSLGQRPILRGLGRMPATFADRSSLDPRRCS